MTSSSKSLRSNVPDLAGMPSPAQLVRMHPWECPIPHERADRVRPVEEQAHRDLCGSQGNPPRRLRQRVRPEIIDEQVIVCQLVIPMIRDLYLPSGNQFANPLKRTAHHTSERDMSRLSEMPSNMRHPIYSRPFDLKHVEGDCPHTTKSDHFVSPAVFMPTSIETHKLLSTKTRKPHRR